METPEIIILKVTVEHLILNIFMRNGFPKKKYFEFLAALNFGTTNPVCIFICAV